jgi:hypothetical protein
VKIGKAQVRLPRIIHGRECFLQRALFILAEGTIWQACTNRGGVYSTRPLKEVTCERSDTLRLKAGACVLFPALGEAVAGSSD